MQILCIIKCIIKVHLFQIYRNFTDYNSFLHLGNTVTESVYQSRRRQVSIDDTAILTVSSVSYSCKSRNSQFPVRITGRSTGAINAIQYPLKSGL